jgi:hypothetical protein
VELHLDEQSQGVAQGVGVDVMKRATVVEVIPLVMCELRALRDGVVAVA